MKKRRISVITLILTSLPILCLLIASGWYWYSVLYPSPPASSCGSVERTPHSFDAQKAIAAEDCFTQAFHGCQSISLTYAYSGTDTAASYQFWPTLENGLCNVRGAFTSGVIGSQHTIYLLCTILQRQPNGLLVSGCGANRGDVLIPNK